MVSCLSGATYNLNQNISENFIKNILLHVNVRNNVYTMAVILFKLWDMFRNDLNEKCFNHCMIFYKLHMINIYTCLIKTFHKIQSYKAS